MTDYKPGDVANGYRLSESGDWIPIASPAPSNPSAPWFKQWWGISLIVAGGVIALVVVVGVAIGIIASQSVSSSETTKPSSPHPSATSSEAAADPADENCGSIDESAIGISADQSEGSGLTQLLKVRRPRVMTDHRRTYKLPKDTGESTVLVCEGTGVWSDGTNSPVRVSETVDSDGEEWIKYEPIP